MWGLRHEIERAFPYRFDRGLDRAMSGDEYGEIAVDGAARGKDVYLRQTALLDRGGKEESHGARS
ncbi:MAG: hypothetical protein HYV63_03865 [Candidatus Schekmanbacteria bacterium]|nr:hypothetical protein [Candidatus Schekmanbacteria bacterium]